VGATIVHAFLKMEKYSSSSDITLLRAGKSPYLLSLARFLIDVMKPTPIREDYDHDKAEMEWIVWIE